MPPPHGTRCCCPKLNHGDTPHQRGLRGLYSPRVFPAHPTPTWNWSCSILTLTGCEKDTMMRPASTGADEHPCLRGHIHGMLGTHVCARGGKLAGYVGPSAARVHGHAFERQPGLQLRYALFVLNACLHTRAMCLSPSPSVTRLMPGSRSYPRPATHRPAAPRAGCHRPGPGWRPTARP